MLFFLLKMEEIKIIKYITVITYNCSHKNNIKANVGFCFEVKAFNHLQSLQICLMVIDLLY